MHNCGPLSTLFHDAQSPVASQSEIDWYASRIPANESLALELMCGTGRILVPLLEREHHVHGVDSSAAMLAHCESRVAALGIATTLARQDIAQLNLPFRYGCVYVTAGSFQLIADPAAATAALERVRAHLVPPGLLCIDCSVPADGVQRLAAPLIELRTAALADGTRIALRSETTYWADARLSRAENRYAHRRGARLLAEEHETVSATWYAAGELEALVRAAGFVDVVTGPSPRDDPSAQTSMLTARSGV